MQTDVIAAFKGQPVASLHATMPVVKHARHAYANSIEKQRFNRNGPG